MVQKPTLITILHDPVGKFIPVEQYVNPYKYYKEKVNLFELYERVVINITTETSPILCDILQQSGYDVIVSPKSNLSRARRFAMAYCINNGVTSHYHYCDFDRILYWFMTCPVELRIITEELVKYDFAIYGRTKSAMDSHPPLQRKTEQLINWYYNKKFGTNYDLLAASRSFDKRVMHLLTSASFADDVCVDVEWPRLVKCDRYFAVDGLAYESDHFDIKRNPFSELRLRMNNLKQFLTYLLNKEI